jgi:hypothetical protein
MSKIIIQLQGGLVQEVFITGEGEPGLVYIIDEDTEDIDDECLTKYKTVSGKTGEAVIHTDSVNPLPEDCDMARALNAFESIPMLQMPIVCKCGQRHPIGTTWCGCGRDLNESKERTDHE